MYGIIYMAYNTVSNKKYVGQTTGNLERRKNAHYNNARRNKNNYYFHRALNKYKEWEWNVLQFAYCKKELDALEKYWIWVLNSMWPNGYNLKEGGSNGKHTEKSCRKMSKAKKGMKLTKEHRKKIGKALKGIKFIEEHCKKISETKKGMKFTKEHCKKISEAKKGKIVSEETRQKIRKALTGYKRTEEHRKNMSKVLKGLKRSKQTCKNISEAKKGKHTGAKNHKAKAVICIGNGKSYDAISEAARETGINPGSISNMLNGKSKTAGGYHWKYINKEA